MSSTCLKKADVDVEYRRVPERSPPRVRVINFNNSGNSTPVRLVQRREFLPLFTITATCHVYYTRAVTMRTGYQSRSDTGADQAHAAPVRW